MGKLLQRTTKRPKGGQPKKSSPSNARGGGKRLAPKPTLRQANRWLTENRAQVLRKAKENCIRLTGQETL